MGDINELLARLVTSSEKHEDRYVEQQGQITELLKTLKENEPPPGPNQDTIRAEKV